MCRAAPMQPRIQDAAVGRGSADSDLAEGKAVESEVVHDSVVEAALFSV